MAESVGILVDVTKCTGCRGCQVTCKQWNGLSATETGFGGSYENPPRLGGNTWTRVKFIEGQNHEGQVNFLFRKIQCMHCTEASCVAVCASGAATKLDNGTVVIDQEKCIGCKNCILACPFEAVGFDPVTGTAKKCWYCQNRLVNNLTPACVKTCPSGALKFGSRSQLLVAAKARVAELKARGRAAYLYGEKELGGLGSLYVLDAPPRVYGLPEQPRPATAGVFGNWLGAVVGAAVLTIAPFKMLFSAKAAETEKQPGTGVDESASG